MTTDLRPLLTADEYFAAYEELFELRNYAKHAAEHQRAQEAEIARLREEVEHLDDMLKREVPRTEAAESALAAARLDGEMLDWLESGDACYWVTVQSQPSGKYLFDSRGKGLRTALLAALAQSGDAGEGGHG